MRVLVRADASVRIGSGHVMRCLTLADALRSAGADVRFVCRLLTGHMADAIAARGFDVVRLPAGSGAVDAGPPHVAWLEESPEADAAQCLSALGDEMPFDWLIVDHYALDAAWEGAMRSVARRVMVIDDVADRDHDCDLLLDQNLAPEPRARYASRVPEAAGRLLGPRFALLRPTFRARRAAAPTGRAAGAVPHLFVFLGGADPDDVTSLVLDGLASMPRGSITADVVVGGANPHADAVRDRCEALPGVAFHRQIEAIDALMAQADLAVCSAGSITWERCALGLPAVTVAIAENQRMIGEESARAGTAVFVGHVRETSGGAITAAVAGLLAAPDRLAAMRAAARDLVDGAGAQRVVQAMTAAPLALGIATDRESWIAPWVANLADGWRAEGHHVTVVHDPDDLPETHLAFYLSCGRIAGAAVLARALHNLVVHESALPQGRGWAPLTWQILEGRDDIPVVLIEAGARVDSGDIYLDGVLQFDGHELCDELREAQGRITVELCRTFVHEFPQVLSDARRQSGDGSVYRRRGPDDSRLDPARTLREQFLLLRVVDNERYPAFFEHGGHRYVLRIERLPAEVPG